MLHQDISATSSQHKIDQATAATVNDDVARTLFHNIGPCPLLVCAGTCIHDCTFISVLNIVRGRSICHTEKQLFRMKNSTHIWARYWTTSHWRTWLSTGRRCACIVSIFNTWPSTIFVGFVLAARSGCTRLNYIRFILRKQRESRLLRVETESKMMVLENIPQHPDLTAYFCRSP